MKGTELVRKLKQNVSSSTEAVEVCSSKRQAVQERYNQATQDLEDVFALACAKALQDRTHPLSNALYQAIEEDRQQHEHLLAQAQEVEQRLNTTKEESLAQQAVFSQLKGELSGYTTQKRATFDALASTQPLLLEITHLTSRLNGLEDQIQTFEDTSDRVSSELKSHPWHGYLESGRGLFNGVFRKWFRVDENNQVRVNLQKQINQLISGFAQTEIALKEAQDRLESEWKVYVNQPAYVALEEKVRQAEQRSTQLTQKVSSLSDALMGIQEELARWEHTPEIHGVKISVLENIRAQVQSKPKMLGEWSRSWVNHQKEMTSCQSEMEVLEQELAELEKEKEKAKKIYQKAKSAGYDSSSYTFPAVVVLEDFDSIRQVARQVSVSSSSSHSSSSSSSNNDSGGFGGGGFSSGGGFGGGGFSTGGGF